MSSGMEESDTLHQPKYVLRGHSSAVHAVSFSPNNSRLLTGDAEGWVVSWSLASKRPVASWRAHESAVLGLKWWGREAVTSKLVVWHLRSQDEAGLNQILPVDPLAAENAKPEILYHLTVNTMNFCSFATLPDPWSIGASSKTPSDRTSLLLAVPHTLDSEAIDIFQLPSTHRLSTVLAPKFIQAGMAMALCLRAVGDTIYVVAGYESGHILYHRNSSRKQKSRVHASSSRQIGQSDDDTGPGIFADDWQCLYLSKPHSQPVLSLLVSLDGRYIASSGADSVIALHTFTSLVKEREDEDGTIGATRAVETPHKVVKTGDPGQQGLSTGWDGKLFAMAGWDGKARIYDWDNLQREYLLDWHRDGVYTTALPHSLDPETVLQKDRADNQEHTPTEHDLQRNEVARTTPRRSALVARRERQAQQTKWVAVGGKDSKVSLWDIGS